MLALFPATARIDEHGELELGGIASTALADEFGTPLLVVCKLTVRESAGAYRRGAPEALVVYGTKAFPNVAILRLLAEEGLGADISTLGELAFAQRAGIPGERLVVHGNNKSDEELAAAVEADALFVVIDSVEEVERAAAAGVRRVLVRLTPGIEAETHEAIRTGQAGSKFGLPPEQAATAIAAALGAGLEVAGLHVHLGSQILDPQPVFTTIRVVAAFAATCRSELDWTPAVVDLGGGLGVPQSADEPAPDPEAFGRALVERTAEAFAAHELPQPRLVLEPGRSLVARAGVTLYRVGAVKESAPGLTYVAIDGGMSDNPRPQLYGARYAALLANRAAEEPTGTFTVAGKHCESGDVLIRRASLPEPRRDDVLAVPATGAYTLAMASNYNGVPRPAVVLVSDGHARPIRSRESIDDLLGWEVG